MADYTTLIADLRELNCDGNCNYDDDCIIVQATQAIEALQAENERLKAEHGLLAPVVRCGECKHTKTDCEGAIYCKKWDMWEMPEDAYCSYGRRKDEGGKV